MNCNHIELQNIFFKGEDFLIKVLFECPWACFSHTLYSGERVTILKMTIAYYVLANILLT